MRLRGSLRALWVALLIAATTSVARADSAAQSRDATFKRGNDSYFHAKYPEAIEAYEQVVALGVRSADLYYNLGNAYLKSNQLGPAIFNYERALSLQADAEDIAYNLNTAREAAKKLGEDRLVGVEAVPSWQKFVKPLSLSLVTWLFIGFYLALFTLLIAVRYAPPGFLRVVVITLLGFIALFALSSGAVLGGKLYLEERVKEVVVLPNQLQVKEGPDLNFTTLFTIHAGLKARLVERDQDWLRIRLQNGLEGWVRDRDVGRLE